MHVAQVSAGSALGSPVSDFQHEDHVLLVVLDGFLEQGFHFLGKFTRILVTESAYMFALKKKE